MFHQLKRAIAGSGVVAVLLSGVGACGCCAPAFARQTDTVEASATAPSTAPYSGFTAPGFDVTFSSADLGLNAAPLRPNPNKSRILWNGKFNYLLGANYAWWNYGTDFGTGGWGKYTDWTAINNQFAALNAQGVRVVRWWVFSDCRYAPEFNADGTVSGLDAVTLADVDKALQVANANNLYLMPTILDFSAWHPASFNGTVQMGGRASLITNATVQQTFLDKALKPLLQHVAASPYRKRVLAYDIINEPEGNIAGYWGGSNLRVGAVQTFVRRSAAYIHKYSRGAYATVGSATPYYVGTWKNLGLDFYQVHYYPWMDFNNGAGSGLPSYASLNLDRPCVVGEFATVCMSYGPNDTAPQSARWYLDAIHAKGYAGSFAWSMNAQDSATDWPAFHPLLTQWAQSHRSLIGPQ